MFKYATPRVLSSGPPQLLGRFAKSWVLPRQTPPAAGANPKSLVDEYSRDSEAPSGAKGGHTAARSKARTVGGGLRRRGSGSTLAVELYKKCAQVVETNRQNNVQTFPQHPHTLWAQNSHGRLIPHIPTAHLNSAHKLTRVLHRQKRAKSSVDTDLSAVSPSPITTITNYVYRREETNKGAVQ